MTPLPDFESVLASERRTPSGGTVSFGVGALRFADGHDEAATAIRITHPEAMDGKVCEFAMTMGTFAALLENMMDVFGEAKRRSTQDPTQ
jgi:hypothetical protein